MYIISKFKDYYDGVAGQVGIDKKIIYHRETKEIGLNRNDMFEIEHNLPQRNVYTHRLSRNSQYVTKEDPDYKPIFVCFCGKLYVGYRFIWLEQNNFNYDEVIEFIYDKETIFKRIEKNLTQKNYFNQSRDIKKKIAKFNEDFDRLDGSNALSKYFIQYDTPIFTFSKQDTLGGYHYYDIRNKAKVLTLNPNLTEFGFFKKFDPFTAFQELSMYIGGVLTNPETNMVEIDEEYRMLQRGLDKTSFRQQAPGKKKENRRQNKLKKRGGK